MAARPGTLTLDIGRMQPSRSACGAAHGTSVRLGREVVSQRRVRSMATFVLRLIAPRPDFAQTLTDTEREIMSRHAAHWGPYLQRGDMVAFGPVLTDEDSYGLAVVETDDEQALREFAAQDPVVTTGTAAFELGRMAAGHVRGR
jgi:uncharacterized protein YciI